MVELAEREAVGNDRLAQGMAVGEDVGGLQTLSPAFGIEELAWSCDPDAAKPPELEQVVVAGNDRVGTGRKRALENPVAGQSNSLQFQRGATQVAT